MTPKSMIAATVAVLFTGVALAQTADTTTDAPAHGGMQMGETGGQMPGMSDHMAVMRSHMADMERMMDGMHGQMSGMAAMPASGDPDIDFARAMIVHHEGAVDMAQTLLDTGDDPEMRALAEAVIATQREEIAFMQDWLARNDG